MYLIKQIICGIIALNFLYNIQALELENVTTATWKLRLRYFGFASIANLIRIWIYLPSTLGRYLGVGENSSTVGHC